MKPDAERRVVILGTQRVMIAHGMLILLIGLFAGIGLLISRVGGLEVWPGRIVGIHVPGSPDAWVRLHLGQFLNAFLITLVALVLPLLEFSRQGEKRICWMLVGTGWANTIFYVAALFAPNRALTIGDNRLGHGNLASVIGLLPALVFAFVSIVAVAALARQALRAPN